VHGRLHPAEAGERCETADGVVVHFDPAQPVFSLDVADAGVAPRVSARSHGRLTLVVSTAPDDPSAVGCTEATHEGSWVTLTLPAGAVRVYAATRTGETGPFLAALHTHETPPDAAPAPLPPPAPGTVWARWFAAASDACEGEACDALTLQLSGATTRVIATGATLPTARCVGRSDAVAMGCSGGGDDAVQVVSQGGGYVATLTHTSHGNCDGPCPSTRTRLARFTLPAGQRLVAHPAGVVSW